MDANNKRVIVIIDVSRARNEMKYYSPGWLSPNAHKATTTTMGLTLEDILTTLGNALAHPDESSRELVIMETIDCMEYEQHDDFSAACDVLFATMRTLKQSLVRMANQHPGRELELLEVKGNDAYYELTGE